MPPVGVEMFRNVLSSLCRSNDLSGLDLGLLHRLDRFFHRINC
jgi:hypothetical protein